MRRLSVSSQRREGELLSRARRAIAVQNQPSALPLLRELAEGGTPPEPLAPAVGDALVATARGAKQDPADRSALARLELVEGRRDPRLRPRLRRRVRRAATGQSR